MNILSFEAFLRAQVFDAIHRILHKNHNLYMCCVAMDMIFCSNVDPRLLPCTQEMIVYGRRQVVSKINKPFSHKMHQYRKQHPEKCAKNHVFLVKILQILYEIINYASFAPNL